MLQPWAWSLAAAPVLLLLLILSASEANACASNTPGGGFTNLGIGLVDAPGFYGTRHYIIASSSFNVTSVRFYPSDTAPTDPSTMETIRLAIYASNASLYPGDLLGTSLTNVTRTAGTFFYTVPFPPTPVSGYFWITASFDKRLYIEGVTGCSSQRAVLAQGTFSPPPPTMGSVAGYGLACGKFLASGPCHNPPPTTTTTTTTTTTAMGTTATTAMGTTATTAMGTTATTAIGATATTGGSFTTGVVPSTTGAVTLSTAGLASTAGTTTATSSNSNTSSTTGTAGNGTSFTSSAPPSPAPSTPQSIVASGADRVLASLASTAAVFTSLSLLS